MYREFAQDLYDFILKIQANQALNLDLLKGQCTEILHSIYKIYSQDTGANQALNLDL